MAALVCACIASGAHVVAEAAEAPRVVVSIPALHSLVAGVMAGVGAPDLLIDGASSPHAYSLRPAAARALAAADAIFWIGPDLETFLPKPIATLAGRARVVTVMEDPEIKLFPVREGGVWEDEHENADEPAVAAEHDTHAHGQSDPHVWLDPRNAQRIVAQAAVILGEIDPGNVATYQANAQRLTADLATLEQVVAAKLAPVRSVPFIVFHDAYHYFEARFGLNAVGAFALSPGTAPGARRVAELHARIGEAGAVCVFVEPQFEPAVVEAAVAGTGARVAVLDPLGAGLPPGANLFAQLLRALADNLATCLGGAP
jgi:zinc transport system substrate-binding protein